MSVMKRASSGAERRPGARAGFAVATAVVLLLLLNILAFGAIRGGGDESAVASLRVETLRALFACDAGLIVTMGELERGVEIPEEGLVIDLDGASAEIAMEVGAGEGVIGIVGTSGHGRRRVVVEVGETE